MRRTEQAAWQAADELLTHLDPATIEAAQKVLARYDSHGQQRQRSLNLGNRESLLVGPNLWSGVGLVRGGVGTALVGSPESIAERMQEYAELGIDTFILSGYPHLEEAYRTAELLFPRLPLSPRGKAEEPAGLAVGEFVANDHAPAKR